MLMRIVGGAKWVAELACRLCFIACIGVINPELLFFLRGCCSLHDADKMITVIQHCYS